MNRQVDKHRKTSKRIKKTINKHTDKGEEKQTDRHVKEDRVGFCFSLLYQVLDILTGREIEIGRI